MQANLRPNTISIHPFIKQSSIIKSLDFFILIYQGIGVDISVKKISACFPQENHFGSIFMFTSRTLHQLFEFRDDNIPSWRVQAKGEAKLKWHTNWQPDFHTMHCYNICGTMKIAWGLTRDTLLVTRGRLLEDIPSDSGYVYWQISCHYRHGMAIKDVPKYAKIYTTTTVNPRLCLHENFTAHNFAPKCCSVVIFLWNSRGDCKLK